MKKIVSFIVLCAAVVGVGVEVFERPAVKPEQPAARHEAERETDEPAMFLELHRGIRTRADESAPSYPEGYRWDALEQSRSWARRARAGARTKSNGVLAWTERGPGNVPGRTRALYNVPGDPANNTWLAGAATGGIWRTTDGGASWAEKSRDFPVMPISSFAADQNATVIYAGTGEFVSSIYSVIGNGIFKSVDKGVTWTQLPSTNNNPEFSIITRIVVHPSDPNIIVATTVPHNLSADNTSAIMRSTNGGATWTKVKEVTGFFEQIIATPGNFNVQYAAQKSAGVWKSTDAGITWNLSNTGMVPSGRIEIAVSPVNPAVVFASAQGALTGNGSDLYHSSNAGASWSLVDVRFNNNVVDFLDGQGFYDNTIMCDPFDEAKVYFGGVSLFKTTLTSGSSQVDQYKIIESGTQSFLLLQSFANIVHDKARLTVGSVANSITVEIRFGPGQEQKAHRFTVPSGATSGVPAASYSYQNYVTIPVEAWDVTNNRQLMVSFRDQNQNGKFDLVPSALSGEDPPDKHSREYFYVSDVAYDVNPHPDMDQAGGQEYRLMYNFFPALAAGATWNDNNLPVSKLIIRNDPILKLNASTVTVADGRNAFDGKNRPNQITLSAGVHPDHHFMVPIITNEQAKTFKILLANDGGVFLSKASDSPGTTQGDWFFQGLGYNTSQFYGADKKPGADQYIGGMQDNGTRYSPAGESASALSNYVYALGGDGFEVIWNSKDPSKILGSIYNGQISRSVNGGATWQSATNGFTPSSTEFSFFTKLANSKDLPDRVFTPGVQGVYISEDFAGTWQLTPIPQKYVIGTPLYLDIEVSRANPNIVWAGSGMNNSGTLRSLHVSTNGGKSFTATNNFTTVTLGNITRLASHPAEPNTAYALFSFSKSPKLLRTTDLGQTWQDISGFGTSSASTNGFPDVAVYCLYVRPDNPNIIWVGTEIGIVESVNNGQTWALIENFPNVSVWDLKGQDNQVVIATHGRGIWTATINASQNVVKVPEVLASGTSPQSRLAMRIQSPADFDSMHVIVNNIGVKTIIPVATGIFDIELNGISAGEKEIKLISYSGQNPHQSIIHKMTHLNILAPKNSYSTYFNTINDLTVQDLTLQGFTSTSLQRKTLHSDHNYAVNKNYQVIIRTPIVVSSTASTLYYSDIAIIEPQNDSVVVEATTNGLDWVGLRPSYDVTLPQANGMWQSAFALSQPGTSAMFVDHEVNVHDKFEPGDQLLFRFRMVSGPSVTSWGWALDYVSIQAPPLGVERNVRNTNVRIFPNPSVSDFQVEYSLEKTSLVTLHIVDAFGRSVGSRNVGMKLRGTHREDISLHHVASGNYIVVIHSDEGKKMAKVSIVR